MSIVHVTSVESSGIPADRTLFVGSKTPNSIKLMSKELNKINKSAGSKTVGEVEGKLGKQAFRKLLEAAVADFEDEELDSSIFTDLCDQTGLKQNQIFTVYSGLLELLRCALKLPHKSLKQDIFKEDLSDLKVPDVYIGDISNVVFGPHRGTLNEKLSKNGPHLPKLDTFRWRVDVGISTSALNRVLQPSILMETTLSDGNVTSYEVPVAKFHQLRYSVANVLKEMEDLKKRNIFKILD